MMKLQKWGWAVVAAGCAAIVLWGGAGPETNLLILSGKPLTLLGLWLRTLSLSGVTGNALAVLLYVLIGLSPLISMMLRRRCAWMPVAISAYLFFLIFMMVNPSKIGALFHSRIAGQEALAAQQMVLVMLFYMLVLSWILVRAVMRSDVNGLARSLIRLVWWVGVILVLSVVYVDLATLKAALAGFGADPSDAALMPGLPESVSMGTPADPFLAVMRFCASSAPSLALLYALPAASRLIAGCGRELFAEGNVALARTLTRRSRATILVSVGCMLGRGFLELAFARYATNVSMMAEIPILELLVAVASALFARFMERGCAVYRENQMMI